MEMEFHVEIKTKDSKDAETKIKPSELTNFLLEQGAQYTNFPNKHG